MSDGDGGYLPGGDAGPWDRVAVSPGAPAGRCGLTFEYDDAWRTGSVTCWRPTWRDFDRCIWHADVPDKPVDELAATPTGSRKRLDGAVLRECDLRDRVAFPAYCHLPGADFAGGDLRGVDLSNADLRNADFTGADLREADVVDAYMPWVRLDGADLREADLSDCFLGDATMTDADLRETDLTAAFFQEDAIEEAIR